MNTDGTVAVTDSNSTQTSVVGAWRVGGNAHAATQNFGTSSNNHVDIVTNGVVRGRISNLGEFFYGATNTTLSGDLVNAIGNAPFPWALNGYSSFNGSGVYGAVQGGTTVFAGVQGEYLGTAPLGAGVRGLYMTAGTGTGFTEPTSGGSGVRGSMGSSSPGAYTFGVRGYSPAVNARSGAILGSGADLAFGGVGYCASNLVDYSFYGFGTAYQTGTGGGSAERAPVPANAHIGLGLIGGVMGGWMRGKAYGLHVQAERSSLYVDGRSVNTQPTVQLIDTPGNQRAVTYAVSSPSPDVYVRGRSSTRAGRAVVNVPESFRASVSARRSLRDAAADVVVTVTPMGESKGLYIAAMTDEGFEVRENGGGNADVPFAWIAMATRADVDTDMPAEVVADNFDGNMRGVMNNDISGPAGQPLWWDGSGVRFDQPPPRGAALEPVGIRPRD